MTGGSLGTAFAELKKTIQALQDISENWLFLPFKYFAVYNRESWSLITVVIEVYLALPLAFLDSLGFLTQLLLYVKGQFTAAQYLG